MESMRKLLGKILAFYARLIKNRVALCFASGFLVAKIWSNVALGGRLIIGIRSGLMGLGTTAVGLGLIHLLSERTTKHSPTAGPSGTPGFSVGPQPASPRATGGLLFLVLWWGLWVSTIVGRLQRLGYAESVPLLARLPVAIWLDAFARWVAGWHVWSVIPGLKGFMVENIVCGQLMLVLIPSSVLFLMRYRRGYFTPACRSILPALPFLLVYGVAFVLSRISFAQVILLLYAFLYPGVTEEFFCRGRLQPLLLKSGATPSTAVAVTALIFAAGHIPDFVLRVYQSMLPLAMGQVASVALYGAFLGYGVYRSGMLWPWMLVHALSDATGI